MTTTATIDDIDVAGRRVLVRVDFNVPLRDGQIADDHRIRAALPTLRALRERGARLVVMTHVGRPRGAVVPALAVAPVAERLSELLGVPVAVAPGIAGDGVERMVAALRPGDVCMLENLRFDPREERNDPELAAALARLGDVYVNDAFGTAHRAHASTEGVAHDLPAVAGYLMARELEALRGVLETPRRPLVAVLGGAKVSTKLGVIHNLLPRVDALWIGGAMACTFFRAMGAATGRSLVEEDQVGVAAELLREAGGGGRLRLPADVVVAPRAEAGAPARTVPWDAIGAEDMVVDVGAETVARIAADCAGAGTVVWNGPLGIYEIDDFAVGTRTLAERVAASGATTVIGGGDLAAAVAAAGVADRISHVSTGGGATLEFLEGRELPGVVALWDRERARREGKGVTGAAADNGSAGGDARPAAHGERRPLVAGNWKMHTSVEEGLALAQSLRRAVAGEDGVDVAVLPPFTHLWPLRAELDGGAIRLGAQDCSWEESGALTGEVSAAWLRGWCAWVLVGHSERRHVIGEDDGVVARKLARVLSYPDLGAILAVGETLEEREADRTREVVERQLRTALDGVTGEALARVVVAYEPVWAIGTGRTATPDQAQEVCALIRAWVRERDASAADSLRVLYGGSVTAGNAEALFSQPDIDGGLIGGASLDAAAFARIVEAARPRAVAVAG